jgi:Zn-dependent M28 family amino/carboxypeptidase
MRMPHILTTLAFASTAALAQAPAKPVPPMPADPMIRKMAGEVSAKRIEANIRKLVSFGTRNTLSDQKSETRGIGAARRWIKSELDKCAKDSGGRLQVAFDEHLAPVSRRIPQATPLVNVVATLPGTMPVAKDRLYVVSGHYDSMPSSPTDPEMDAPGANDDGSGTAVVMELACVMSKYEFDATLVFMTVAGEEQGLLGARFWAERAKAQGLNVAGMITNDIVGNTKGFDGTVVKDRVRIFAEGVPAVTPLPEEVLAALRTGGENDLPTRQLARFIKESAERHIPNMKVDLIYRRDRYLRGGDHIPFLESGYPAVRFTEPNENWRHQHQNVRVEDGVQLGDLPEFVDFEYTANVARVNAAALAALALGPGVPQNVEMENLRLENNTTLRWKAGTEPDIAGYRIVWRETTSPFWQWAQDVGNVTRETVIGVSKDNVQFGVQAYDKQGRTSVVAYPKPYRP